MTETVFFLSFFSELKWVRNVIYHGYVYPEPFLTGFILFSLKFQGVHFLCFMTAGTASRKKLSPDTGIRPKFQWKNLWRKWLEREREREEFWFELSSSEWKEKTRKICWWFLPIQGTCIAIGVTIEPIHPYSKVGSYDLIAKFVGPTFLNHLQSLASNGIRPPLTIPFVTKKKKKNPPMWFIQRWNPLQMEWNLAYRCTKLVPMNVMRKGKVNWVNSTTASQDPSWIYIGHNATSCCWLSLICSNCQNIITQKE